MEKLFRIKADNLAELLDVLVKVKDGIRPISSMIYHRANARATTHVVDHIQSGLGFEGSFELQDALGLVMARNEYEFSDPSYFCAYEIFGLKLILEGEDGGYFYVTAKGGDEYSDALGNFGLEGFKKNSIFSYNSFPIDLSCELVPYEDLPKFNMEEFKSLIPSIEVRAEKLATTILLHERREKGEKKPYYSMEEVNLRIDLGLDWIRSPEGVEAINKKAESIKGFLKPLTEQSIRGEIKQEWNYNGK